MKSKYSNREIQKEAEGSQISLFKKLFESDNDVNIKLIENDPPDAECFVDGKRIAIELTELIWDLDVDGINKKAHESTGKMIVDMARIEYEKLSLPPIYVSVSFNDNYGLKKDGKNLQLYSEDKKRLSSYIVKKVIEYIPEEANKWTKVPEYNENWERIIDDKISKIRIAKLDVLDENCWVTGGAASIPILTYEKLLDPIKAKERKLDAYRNRFDEVWLVIVEGWDELAGYFDFRNLNEIQKESVPSEFNRVFVLQSNKSELIELNLAK
jgi:hypothetical protein